MKSFFGSILPHAIVQLPAIGSEKQSLIFPLAILNIRTIIVEGQPKTQVLVQWESLPIEDSSWKDSDIFSEMFPHLNLEDQVRFDGEMNVTNVAEEGTIEEGTEKGIEASSINGSGSAGNDSMKRI